MDHSSSSSSSCDAGVPSLPCGTVRSYRSGCRCLGCRVAIRKHNKRYREKKPGEVRAAARRRELMADYGITPEQLTTMKIAQGWRCAICRKRFPPEGVDTKQVHVDHCHETGHVRGVLCARCNSGLGKLGDSIEGLERALAYLKRASTDDASSA